MKLSLSTFLLGNLIHFGYAQNQYGELPHIADIIETAYPTWCIDEKENRIMDVETCADGSPNGRYNPRYFTKQYSGGDPALGGYPTNIDINYVFEYAAPFYGQACAGSPHHCPEDFDGSNEDCSKCPKLKTSDDNGPYGPGHIPPHIALAATTRAYNEGFGGDVKDWFLYDLSACRILPNVLYTLIREYYPRDENGNVDYPPPFADAGGAYPLEFINVAGEGCEKEKEKLPLAGELECFEQHSGDISLYPDYLDAGHGSPHYCTKEGKEAGVYNDWCPYIFFGPNRGMYRHPHIAFSALETYLANQAMPDKCGATWDDSNYPPEVTTVVAFPEMEGGFPDLDGLEAPEQPTIKDQGFIWPGPNGKGKKPVVGNFATNLHIVEGFTAETDSSAAIETELKMISFTLLAMATFLIV